MMSKVKRFAIVGVSGFVAPRHLKAIKENGGELLAALDPCDSVGIMDSYFPNASFFTEFERFDRYIDKTKRSGEAIDYLSICSPNYLHDAHIRFGLRNHADVICEKPLVLNPWNLDSLSTFEEEFGKKVYTILQLRHHPEILKLKERYKNAIDKAEIELTYITGRGKWYYASWKGEESKSGGIATNIGIHFFDMLMWIFGGVKQNIVHLSTHDRAAGFLELEKARVKWFLSINSETIPNTARSAGLTTYRVLSIDGEQVDFSAGFTDLHSTAYQKIMDGNGYGIQESAPSIELAYNIRHKIVSKDLDQCHPFCLLPQSPHPFSL